MLYGTDVHEESKARNNPASKYKKNLFFIISPAFNRYILHLLEKNRAIKHYDAVSAHNH
jgi:hypothetical protein